MYTGEDTFLPVKSSEFWARNVLCKYLIYL